MKKLVLLALLGCSAQPPTKVHYMPNVLNNLINIYDNRSREMPICLLGNKKGDTYIIDDIKIPVIYSANNVSTSFSPEICQNKKYLGMIHNHSDYCQPSEVDINRFIHDKKAKIETIVCEVAYPDGIRLSTTRK